MAGYIRLPRESEEDDRRAIGTNSEDSSSLQSNMDFLSDYTMRTAWIELFLRVLGGKFAIISLVTMSITCHLTNNRAAPVAALFAITAALLINLALVAWYILKRVVKKMAICEACKKSIMNSVPTSQKFFIIVDGVISLMSFITSICVLATRDSYWNPRTGVKTAAGVITLFLSFVHAALLAPEIISRVEIEVRFVRRKSSQNTPASAAFGPNVTGQEAKDALETQPLTELSYVDAESKA